VVPIERSSEVTTSKGIPVAPAPKRARSSKCTTLERQPDDALSTLKFSAIDETWPSNTERTGDMSEVELGIAFVASALGRVAPRVSSEQATTDMPDCYVEMTSTRKKAKTPVSVAPPNSVDSDVDRDDTGSKIRLSRSDVHIEIPGEVREPTTNVIDAGRAAAVVVSEGLSNQALLPPRVEVATAGAEVATADRAVERAITSTPNTDDITSFCSAVSSMDATGGYRARRF